MAGAFKIVHVQRPAASTFDEATKRWTEAPGEFLLITGDPFTNGGTLVTVSIRMSDFDGLLEEWEAGAGGTLLAAAVADFASTTFGSDPTFGTGLTANQRVAYVAEEVAYGP